MELSVIADEVCATSCCAARPYRTASELCDRGLRRNRLEPFALVGTSAYNDEGLVVRFSLQYRDALITAVRFKASTCASLLAYCELIVELAMGRSIAECAGFTPHLLTAELPDIPVMKRDRAVLAVTAFRSALAHAAVEAAK